MTEEARQLPFFIPEKAISITYSTEQLIGTEVFVSGFAIPSGLSKQDLFLKYCEKFIATFEGNHSKPLLSLGMTEGRKRKKKTVLKMVLPLFSGKCCLELYCP